MTARTDLLAYVDRTSVRQLRDLPDKEAREEIKRVEEAMDERRAAECPSQDIADLCFVLGVEATRRGWSEDRDRLLSKMSGFHPANSENAIVRSLWAIVRRSAYAPGAAT